jgi:SRSO17 transposase
MNHATTAPALPDLTADFLGNQASMMDNLFASLWKSVGMDGLLYRSRFSKRSGVPVNEVMFCLILWVWAKVSSISLFSRESLGTFSSAGKDVLYEAMNREDWNWRSLHLKVAQKALQQLKPTESAAAFVLDDSIKIRHGKKMPGISSHFDHTTGRHVMGQQVLTLGLSCPEGFVPLDSELFISKVKAQGLPTPFADGRSIAAKRYRVAQLQSKPEMAKAMIARAQATGINANYLLADAWFGTKQMIKVAEDANLVSIVRMKKSAMKYRLRQVKQGKLVCRDLDLNGLYQAAVRGEWETIPGQRFQAKNWMLNLISMTRKLTPQSA